MKIFGGGTLLREMQTCMDFFLGQDGIRCAAVGMRSFDEVDTNIWLFNGENVDTGKMIAAKKLSSQSWCTACGTCVSKCGQGALKLGKQHAEVDHEKCVACGYCASCCPKFAIRVI